MKKNPAYKEFMEKKESEAKDAEFKRQGEMLASIVGGKLGQALQVGAVAAPVTPLPAPPVFPPIPPAVAGSPGSSSLASGVAGSPRGPIDISHTSTLSEAQKVIMVSMFGKAGQTDGTYSEVEQLFTKNWTSNPSVIKKMNELIKANSTSELPRPKKERINLFWETLRKLN